MYKKPENVTTVDYIKIPRSNSRPTKISTIIEQRIKDFMILKKVGSVKKA